MTHSGDGSITCRGRPAKIASSSSAFRGLFEALYLVRHRSLKERPHLQPETKNERFQRLTAALLYLAHDLLCESDHREEGRHRWRGLHCGLYERLRVESIKQKCTDEGVEGRNPTFACSNAGSMICFQMAFKAAWSSFESRVAGRRLSLLNTLSVGLRARGVTGSTSVAGVETPSSAGKGAESVVGENR
jgi:hypothetical protein